MTVAVRSNARPPIAAETATFQLPEVNVGMWPMMVGAFLVPLVGRRKGVDPTKEGSGNPGATNMYRTAGKSAGAIVLVGDMLKGLIIPIVGLAVDDADLVLTIGYLILEAHAAAVTDANGDLVPANLVAYDQNTAQLARQHNDANVIGVGARAHDLDTVDAIALESLASTLRPAGRETWPPSTMTCIRATSCAWPPC